LALNEIKESKSGASLYEMIVKEVFSGPFKEN